MIDCKDKKRRLFNKIPIDTIHRERELTSNYFLGEISSREVRHL